MGMRLLTEHSATERGFDIDETAEVIGWLNELGVNYIYLVLAPSFRAVSFVELFSQALSWRRQT